MAVVVNIDMYELETRHIIYVLASKPNILNVMISFRLNVCVNMNVIVYVRLTFD